MAKMVSKNGKCAKLIRYIFVILSFAMSMYAYWPWLGTEELQTMSDWLYQSLDLMTGASPLKGTNEGFMTWARFLCPAFSGVFLFSFFTAGVNRVLAFLRSLHREIRMGSLVLCRDSVAIYGDNHLAKASAEGSHYIQAGDHFLKHAKNHIIIMDHDDESLSFYKKHEADLSSDITYIGLQQISSFLMKSSPNVFYFNIYEEVSRAYWREFSIRQCVEEKPEYQIVILGYSRDNLGFQLLKYGILNNIFRRDQKITYHIFCKPEEQERGFEQLNMMTQDTIVWHSQRWQTVLDVICGADRILLCRAINPHILNQLLLSCTDQHIHYYDPDSASYPDKYEYRRMRAFGCTRDVLNDNSILKCELYQSAMERNYQYTKEYGSIEDKTRIREAEESGTSDKLKLQYWNHLSGFLKNSNSAAADFYTINPITSVLTKDEIERRAELEHIRWSRFHYLCGWKYGIPGNGKAKDPEMRIHRCLIPWDDLPEIEKEKDRQQVLVEAESIATAQSTV